MRFISKKTNQKKYFKRSDLEQKQSDIFFEKQSAKIRESDSDHEKNSYHTVSSAHFSDQYTRNKFILN